MRTRVIEEKKLTTRDIQSKEPNGILVSLWKDWEKRFW